MDDKNKTAFLYQEKIDDLKLFLYHYGSEMSFKRFEEGLKIFMSLENEIQFLKYGGN
ncbi:MAG: hypothetical protein AB1798_08475 [Spirochaetota bacterium]